MTAFRTLLAISVVTAALAMPAAAQQGIVIPSGSLLMVDSSGKATVSGAGKMAHGMMTRNGKSAGAGLILYNDGGRIYSMADKRMAGGKMLSSMFLEDFQTAANRAR